jgi:sugar phosphate isomerase/epimerase
MPPSFRASRPLSLAHLTIGEVLPPHVAAIAAATGFDSISLRLNSPRQAVRIVRGAGAATSGVIVDALHLQRTGGTPADVAATEPTLIAGVQLCDGPPTMEADGIVTEARCDRQFLGEGAFPLAQLLAVIPEALPIALEIPAERLRLRGESALERAQRARDSYTRMFE